MKYEPRKINKNKKLMMMGISLLFLVSISLYTKANEEQIVYPNILCSMDNTKALEIINTQPQESYEVEDYFFYGETLNLVSSTYTTATKSDPLVSKSISIYNLCNGQESMFILENNKDRQIPLDGLKPGVYALYVNDNLTKKRITMDKSFQSSIHTITRAGKNYEVTVFSDASYFQHPDVVNQNQIFIDVKEVESEQYDIVIDPLLYNYDFSYVPSTGLETNDKYTYEYNFDYARLLKEKLEAKGLKVLLTKNAANEIINTYGADGRLAKAYESGAKYYIAIGFLDMPYPNINGVDIEYSVNTSMRFANSILYDLKRELGMSGSNYYSTGIHSSILVEGIDGMNAYGNNLYLREVGGKALHAGMYSENSIEGTSAFAKDNIYGMQGLQISLGYLSNQSDLEMIQNNQEAIVEVLANSIAKYLHVTTNE